jgi:hypothetical protein
MIYISHRGNLTGKEHSRENHIPSINECIERGFDVEIDVWKENGKFYLGHDKPEKEISKQYLIDNAASLWIHCKNKEALIHLQLLNYHDFIVPLHYFWHQDDDYAITSKNWVISFPGKPPGGIKSVCMSPEYARFYDEIPEYLNSENFRAVCSNGIEFIRSINTKP